MAASVSLQAPHVPPHLEVPLLCEVPTHGPRPAAWLLLAYPPTPAAFPSALPNVRAEIRQHLCGACAFDQLMQLFGTFNRAWASWNSNVEAFELPTPENELAVLARLGGAPMPTPEGL